MVIGEEQVFELIREARPEVAPTTPITGAFAAFRALGAKRIGVLTPYRDAINQFMRDYIEARGFEVPVFGSFNEENDNKVARIAPVEHPRGAAGARRRRRRSTPSSSPAPACASPRSPPRSRPSSASP